VQNAGKAVPDGSSPAGCTVIGLPMAYSKTSAQVAEVNRAIDGGAAEIDAVITIAAVKDKDWAYVENEIDAMTRATQMRSKKIKIILETSLLNAKEIQKVCEMINRQESDFAKTSTGYGGGGAESTIIKLMRRILDEKVQIKASGGIKTYQQALEMIEAGASRIGSSNPKLLVP